MDNPTGSRKYPAASAPRWVSADALLRHLERDEEGDGHYRYTSLAPLPAGPPPDPLRVGWRAGRRPGRRAQRDRTPVELPPRNSHGTWNAYNKFDCRCTDCTDAATLAQRRFRHRRRERRQQEQERQRQGSAA